MTAARGNCRYDYNSLVPKTWNNRGSLFSGMLNQRTNKDRERFGGTNATGAIIGHFSPFSALKGRKKVERGCVLSRNILRLAGWRESKPCPATKSEKPAFLLRKALGLDRVTPTLQRNREKKPPGNEKSRILRGFFSFRKLPKTSQFAGFEEENGNKERSLVAGLLLINIGN